MAFLLPKSRQAEFDRRVEALDAELGGQLLFKVVGPLPPYSFSTIEIEQILPDDVTWASSRWASTGRPTARKSAAPICARRASPTPTTTRTTSRPPKFSKTTTRPTGCCAIAMPCSTAPLHRKCLKPNFAATLRKLPPAACSRQHQPLVRPCRPELERARPGHC